MDIFSNRKLSPFHTLSLQFILKIFLKFRKFEPQYPYKIYSYRKKKKSVVIYVLYLSLTFLCCLIQLQ